ncbi:MAG: type II secretory pathway pseudopilin PulG [Cryomorphaceae bacterium]|jgi:type II secretory pathway pseudopilin PulG
MKLSSKYTRLNRFFLKGKCRPSGFALVASLIVMTLLMIIALAMLSLSSSEVRSSQSGRAMAQAQSNARLALMMAIGELQMEMGPDMRISAEAAIHDSDPSTEDIDDIAQPHWLAVYDSWGDWLNNEYTPEGKDSSEVSNIGDTYVAKRAPMFRRWLVSLPEDLQSDVDAPVTALEDAYDPEESIIMVGPGTLGLTYATANPEKVTRAYKIKVGDRGAKAWWIGPENHKAKLKLAAQERTLTADQWATSQGSTAELAVGKISGLEKLDIADPDAPATAEKLLTLGTLHVSGTGIDMDVAKQHFFDLTEASFGVLSNSKTGGLKKDLSLLFENNDSTIPVNYKQKVDKFSPEPSIRPHSTDVLAENAALPRRPFASWPNMRHYYRMYRQDTDPPHLSVGSDPLSQRNRNLNFTAGKPPSTGIVSPWNMRYYPPEVRWLGENSYLRYPVMTRFLNIHAYATENYFETRNNSDEIALRYYDIPVMTLWNPYSTPLSFPSGNFGVQVGAPVAWPNKLGFYYPQPDGRLRTHRKSSTFNHGVPIKSDDGSDIVFQPGEFKVFSFKPGVFLSTRETVGHYTRHPDYGLFEGFDPLATGGITTASPNNYYNRISDQDVIWDYEFDVTFDRARGGNSDARNTNEGNSPGSLTIKMGFATDGKDDGVPSHYQIDWFNNDQLYESITRDEVGARPPLREEPDIMPLGYSMLALKTTNRISMPADWKEDWRSRNWLHAPPTNFGSGLYMSEDPVIGHTQRMDSPYEVSFGPTSPFELGKLTPLTLSGKPTLGFGSNPFEKVSAVPAIELPSAPLSSLASFSGMRITPGWIFHEHLNPDWHPRQRTSRMDRDGGRPPVSFYNAYAKHYAYQSGITAGGIGNSFIHPMIPRDEIYFHHDNSKSQEHVNMMLTTVGVDRAGINDMHGIETKAYSDYWDHGLVLNDALWDEYFISSIADQTRPWASASDNLQANIDKLTTNEALPISRYRYNDTGIGAAALETKLVANDGYLKAAEHLMVDGAFNVNSTSVKAWYALFAGIRERALYYRNTDTGALELVDPPIGHVVLSRLDTPTTKLEVTDPGSGVVREDGYEAWSGVRFIDDDQLKLLAQKCVEQVKLRGPFLNLSEFINRRLEVSDLGLMGALQSAIDYDDASPDPNSINYTYKSNSALMMTEADLGVAGDKTPEAYQTPEAVNGSRLAGIPGYVIQSDLLKPIANTLTVRDDTFRIRAYGESLDANGNVLARAWCEAVVQRVPEYVDGSNESHEPAYQYIGNPTTDNHDPGWDGEFVKNSALSEDNRRFGRKFEIKSFRWLNPDEV